MPSLRQVDELVREHHGFLNGSDKCYYLYEYTAGRGYAFSPANNLIYNIKKSPELRGTPQWYYKERDINRAADELRQVLTCGSNFDWLRTATLVPIPPSKVHGDPLHDDRICKLLQRLGLGLNLDIRELVKQRDSMCAAHESEIRPRPEEIAANYCIDESLAAPTPQYFGIFDDLLTAGSHFRAMQTVLERRFPGTPIAGFFIARRVPEPTESLFDLIVS